MGPILYLVAFVVLGAGAHLGGKIVNGHIVNQPRDPRLLNAISGIATLATVGWFVWGFFLFSWWVPLLAIPLFAICGAWITLKAQRANHAPGIAMALIVAGLAIAGVVVANA